MIKKTEVESKSKLQSLKSNYSISKKTEVENRAEFETIKSNSKSKNHKGDEVIEEKSENENISEIRPIPNVQAKSNVKDKIVLFNENAKGGQLLLKPKISYKTPVKKIKRNKFINSASKSKKITSYYKKMPNSDNKIQDQTENALQSSNYSTTLECLNFENKAENRSAKRPKSDVIFIPQNQVLNMPDNPANPQPERTETSFLKSELKSDKPLVGLPNPGNADTKENASFASIFSMKTKSFVGKDIQKRIMKLTGSTSRIDSSRFGLQTPGKRKYQEIADDDKNKKMEVGSSDYSEN